MYLKGVPLMRHLPLYLFSVILLTSCSEDSSQPTTQVQETPKSLSGEERHQGPNPHAKLTTEQHISVAMQHADNGRVSEALDVLSRAIAESPNDASLIGTRGSLLLAQNQVYEALVDFKKAVAIAPNSAVLRVNRAQAFRRFNLIPEARSDLDTAITLDPKLVPARFNRGVLLYDDGKYQDALNDFNVCIEVAPKTAGPYFNRAVTRDAMNDLDGAKSDMKTFISLADNPEWIKIAKDTLVSWETGEPLKAPEN